MQPPPKLSEAQSLAEFLALVQFIANCNSHPHGSASGGPFQHLQRGFAAEEPEDEHLEMESMSSALDDIVPPTYECPLLSPTHSASSLDSEEEYFVMTSSGQLISMEEHERLYRLEQDMSRMNLKEASKHGKRGEHGHAHTHIAEPRLYQTFGY